MLPKDLLDDLEKGDRTIEMLKVKEEELNNYHQAILLNNNPGSIMMINQQAMSNLGGLGQAIGGAWR